MAIQTLNITKSGTGTGTVTSDVGIPLVDCGVTCSVTETAGNTVTLTAVADPGSAFVGWTGDLISVTNPDSYVQAINPTNIDAEFELIITPTVIGDATAIPLTSTEQLLRSLKIYNCCAAKKGAQYIRDLADGKDCDTLFEDAELMIGLIDSIAGFIYEGDVVSGTQASTGNTWSMQASTGAATVDLTIGASIYPTFFTTTATSSAILAQQIAAYINSFYPQSFPYTAEYLLDGALECVNISGSDYELSNGVIALGDVTTTAGNNPTDLTLVGGVAAVYQGENCITNEEVQIILNKLNVLCSTPCKNIVNFQIE